jgi:hypothetical protein
MTTTQFTKSCKCPVCNATVMVRKSKLSARLMRALALADHVKQLHGIGTNGKAK